MGSHGGKLHDPRPADERDSTIRDVCIFVLFAAPTILLVAWLLS